MVAQRGGGTEAAGGGDVLDRQGGGFQQFAGTLQAFVA
jgi:hypothetical protein